ncbi:hypothetical protein [Thalassotalea sediminis]|uniref:hypothetical protein n=1 Tax=Thalassotalea sediminis TaxID=1759089 RepID=UPI002573D944|nr:hypothetical protein [Thalassotalea sediminis]
MTTCNGAYVFQRLLSFIVKYFQLLFISLYCRCADKHYGGKIDCFPMTNARHTTRMCREAPSLQFNIKKILELLKISFTGEALTARSPPP